MFTPNTNQTLCHFETDLIRGTLQPSGHRHGIRKLIHKPTGLSLVHPEFSLLNVYLLFATGQCIASARSFRRTVSIKSNTITVHCEPTRAHRADLTLIYRLSPPNAIDLSISVRARDHYPGYEALIANYFDLALQPHICTSNSYREPYWFTPTLSELYRDNALIFPRDAESAQLHLDGRWSNVRSIYQWKSQNYYAYPLAMQVHSEHNIAALLMTHPKTCPSLSWTVGFADAKISSHRSDHLDDPLKARNPLYLSQFGHHLHPTVRYITQIRLAIDQLDAQMTLPIKAYQTFATTTKKD